MNGLFVCEQVLIVWSHHIESFILKVITVATA
jgi:hypothetical protein